MSFPPPRGIVVGRPSRSARARGHSDPFRNPRTTPAAPNTTTTATSGEFNATTESANGHAYFALNGYPAGASFPAPSGYQGYGYPAAPFAPAPVPVAPAAPRTRSGLPWFIDGAALLAVGFARRKQNR